MNNSSIKKNAYLLLIALVLLIGGTYAWFTLTINNSKTNIIRAGKLKINLVDCEKDLVLKNAVPVSDNKGMQSEVCTFKVENTGTTSIDYSVYLDDTDELTTDERMNDKYVKFGLIKNDGDPKIGELPTTGVNPDRVLTSEKISGSTTDTYKLRVWINQDADNGVMGTIFSGKVRVDATQSKPPAANLKAIDKTQTISSIVFQVVNDTPTNTSNTNNKAKIKKLDNKKDAEVVKVASMKDQAAASYDVSVEQDKSVMQYNVLNEDGTTYTAYIEASKKIVAPEDSSGLLSGSSITSITGLENLDTSKVVNMSGFFSGIRVSSLDVSSLDTSNVTNMSSMFSGASIPSIDIRKWNVSNVLDMTTMFASSNIPSINLSGLDASKVTTMNQMFSYSSSSSIDVSNLNASNVENMGMMFYQTGNLNTINLSNFNTAKATDMSHMFAYSGISSIDLSTLNTSNVTNMFDMFGYDTNLESLDFSDLDVSKVTNAEILINGSGIKEFTIEGLSWDSLSNFNSIFSSADKLEVLNANNMSLPKVTSIYTFSSLTNIKQFNMNHLNAPKLSSIGRLFSGSKVITDSVDLSYLNAPELTSLSYLAERTVIKNINLSHFVDTSKLVDMGYMFRDTPCIENIDLTGTDTSNVTNINSFFDNSAIQNFDFSQLDTSSVKYLNLFLAGAYKIKSVDLSSFDNSHSYSGDGGTFYSMSLENLDLHGLSFTSADYTFDGIHRSKNIKNLNMSDMTWDSHYFNLSGSSNLQTVDFSNTNAPTLSMAGEFTNANSLISLNLSNFNAPSTTDLTKTFYGTSNLNSLDMTGIKLGKITTLEGTFANTGLSGKLDLTWVDATELQNIEGLFSGSAFTEMDMSGWQANKLASLSGVFSGASKLSTINLSNFNGPNVVNTSGMFAGTTGLKELNLDGIKLGKITNMSGMFSGSGLTGKLDMTWLDASELSAVSGAFSGSGLEEIDMSGWQAPKLTSISGLFSGSSNLNKIDMSNSSYTGLTSLSSGYSSLTTLKNVDLSNTDFSNVQSMGGMFYGDSALIDINVTGIKTGKLEELNDMLSGTTALTSFDFKSLDLSTVTNMIGVATGSGITSVNLDNVDMSALTTLNRAFYGATNLKTFSMKNAKVANATDLRGMFDSNTSLTTVDMSGTAMNALEHIDQIFKDCSSLTTVDISGASLSADVSCGEAFSNAKSGVNVKVKDETAKSYIENVFTDSGATGTATIA